MHDIYFLCIVEINLMDVEHIQDINLLIQCCWFTPLQPIHYHFSYRTYISPPLLEVPQLLHTSLLSLPALSVSVYSESKKYSLPILLTKVQFSIVSKCKQSFGWKAIILNHCDIFVYHQLALVCVYLLFLSCQTSINPMFIVKHTQQNKLHYIFIYFL